jgi:hypothetical protein
MYYEINESTARLSHDNMSMRDYIPNSATNEYRAAVDRAAAVLEEVKAKCKTQAQRERAEHYFDRYAKKLAEAINQENAIGTRCPSVLIAGASNFPVRKKEKQVAAWEANRANFEKADHYLHLLKTAHVQGVKSNDPEALEYLQAKLARLEAAHDEMKQANAYYRKHKTLDGCPGIPEKAREWLTRPGVFAKGDGTPLALYGCPYPAYALQNSNANIKRIRERLEALKAVKASPTQEEQHNGCTYLENSEIMRVQLVFGGKPDEATRALLKANGFRWSPSQGAWQRQLTENGKAAARRVLSALAGLRPSFR